MDLKRYFDNNFDDREISDDELKTFAEDHLRRLANNNQNDQFGPLLTATTTAYTDFFGDISDEATHTAVREGLTLRVNETFQAFMALVRRREGAVRSQYGKDSAEYEEFFPQGLTEYTVADMGNAERLMNRFVDTADAHKTELGQAFHDEFVALRDAFTTARQAQLGKKSAVSGAKSDAKAARKVLTKQLMVNLLTIAAKNVGEPDKAAVYFDQSIIRPAQTKKTGDDAGQNSPSNPA